jgi:hypothetical protein
LERKYTNFLFCQVRYQIVKVCFFYVLPKIYGCQVKITYSWRYSSNLKRGIWL